MLSNAPLVGIKISVSKASLVLTQLNQPVSVYSNITTTSLFVGRERMTFDILFDATIPGTSRIALSWTEPANFVYFFRPIL